jgi:hypothetical protein
MIDKTPDKPNKLDQMTFSSNNTKKQSLIKMLNNIIFDAAANSMVTDKMAPSYTSHNQ